MERDEAAKGIKVIRQEGQASMHEGHMREGSVGPGGQRREVQIPGRTKAVGQKLAHCVQRNVKQPVWLELSEPGSCT